MVAPARAAVVAVGSGSLGWLAHLIRKHKLDLTEIDLAPVAQACYDYWREVGDMDEAGDALATLAYLAERKAQRLLAPDPEPEPDDEADEWLAPTRLPDAYLQLAEHLRQREGARMQLFFRGGAIDPRDYELPPEFGAELPDQLWLAFKRLLEQRMPLPDAIPHRRYFSLHARMIEIRERLQGAAQPLPFDALAQDALDVLDLLVSFPGDAGAVASGAYRGAFGWGRGGMAECGDAGGVRRKPSCD
jgi:chromatin segregation and condensation protein Rec8/ScpA/Scc1 (kleisin family)